MIVAFAAKHPDSAELLDNWHRRASNATWRNLADVRRDDPHADDVGTCTVFNVAGNKYRLITWIKYEKLTIYTRFVLTHADYSRGRWKDDCAS